MMRSRRAPARLGLGRRSEGQKCVHGRGGVCSIHGPGAKKKWRPLGKTRVMGDDGELRWKSNREVYYVCAEVGEGVGRGGENNRLTQLTLKFNQGVDSSGDEDTNIGGRGAREDEQ